MGAPLPIDIACAAVLLWVAVGLCGIVLLRRIEAVTRILLPLGAVGALALCAAAVWTLCTSPQVMELPFGLPGAPVLWRLDALSSWFLLLEGAAGFGISVYMSGYLRAEDASPPGLQCLQYHFFLAAMAGVLLADDAYGFMIAWETMAIASYFLVVSNHQDAETRRAGFLYILIAHLGAIAVLLCFGVMQLGSGDFRFASMRNAHLDPTWAGIAFLLALAGFGAKAGLVPLHAWLPEAHPAAPSPVSALMSGVMLKTAIYGIVRVAFDLLPQPAWWWGATALVVGLASALFGVLFAAVQSDMKRLLAYSSIENLGIIVLGLGLALVFRSYSMNALAVLALGASLFHALSHAFCKSLLFLATGSVLHATAQRSLGRLGGLLRPMPWVGWLALAGTLAIAGLPPLAGFASEWMLLQAFLVSPSIPSPYLGMLVPLCTAGLVLAAALAAYVMVKFYGIIFLGVPREEGLARAHDAGRFERAGLAWCAAGCVALGVLPSLVVDLLDPVTAALIGIPLSAVTGENGPWLLVALAPERASFSPVAFLVGFVVLIPAVWWFARRQSPSPDRRSAPWDCGFPLLDARMQDTAEGFGQPIAQIFESVYRVESTVPAPDDRHPVYRSTISDPLWRVFYLPVARAVGALGAFTGRMQHGRMQYYLIYSFVTLLVLLFFVR